MSGVALELEPRVSSGYVVEQLFAVLAHKRLLVVAPDVVPRDAVAVHVVEHAQTRLLRSVDVRLSVVRLRRLLVAGLAPRAVGPAGRRLVGGRQLAARRRPEPAVHVLRFQVRSVLAALKVAQPPAGPYVRRIICDRKKNCFTKRFSGWWSYEILADRQQILVREPIFVLNITSPKSFTSVCGIRLQSVQDPLSHKREG